MKSIRNLLLAFLLLSISWANAQKISGSVFQSDGSVAEFATVLLYNAADSVLVKGAITDESGQYSIEQVPAGSYFLNSKLLGAGNGASAVFDYDGGDKLVESMSLATSSKELDQVTITARKSVVEVRADKTILNVEGNINSQGQNALELLRKAPGVTVDNNDNVAIKGKNSVRFQIDGRDVRMDSKEVTDMLKTMRAEDVSAIEMITNPSAKYDASGNAGIINFRTKKNKAYGTNGTIGGQAIYGETLKGGANLSFNHRNKKLNVFGSYSNHFGNWANNLNLLRDQQGSQPDPNLPNYDPSRRYDQRTEMTDNNNNHNFKLGTDFFLDSKNTIGFMVNGRHAHGPWESQARTVISSLENPDQIESILIASNRQPQYRDNFDFNVNYRYADKKGNELNIDANRGIYHSRMDSYQPNQYFDAAEQTLLSENIYRNNTPTDIYITIIKADWEQKLWKGKFGVGFKLNDVETDNTFDFYNVINGEALIDTGRSNRFVYREMVNAGYVNYNVQLEKWGFQAGVRAEHTDWAGELTSLRPENNEMPSNEYLSWFPSAAVTYALSKDNQFNLTYSRRIDRPSYRDLNPFEDKLDELTFKKGNPFLRPQFTHSLELTHTFKGAVNTTLGYSNTNDLFTEYIDTAANGVSFLRQGNIATQNNYSLSISTPIPIAKWWESFINVTGVISEFEANFREGYAYTASFSSFNVYNEHTFRLPKGWAFQLSGWFNSPSIHEAIFRTKAMGALSAGVRKQVLDGNGTISVNVGDILGTAGWRSVNDYTPGLYMKGNGNWESQNVKLNFSYRFGNKNVKGSRQRKTGTEDVNSRIKSGN
ncbi:MAG: TonB-dependent receptor [Lewinellaceae bacterium]|nr:TonB-dependent receptor [Saprospiraceae bacterium]MCB9345248.1 TonB-dependent receptor [Lewinellaceae bacterium]